MVCIICIAYKGEKGLLVIVDIWTIKIMRDFLVTGQCVTIDSWLLPASIWMQAQLVSTILDANKFRSPFDVYIGAIVPPLSANDMSSNQCPIVLDVNSSQSLSTIIGSYSLT